jgi:hypothetical protein
MILLAALLAAHQTVDRIACIGDPAGLAGYSRDLQDLLERDATVGSFADASAAASFNPTSIVLSDGAFALPKTEQEWDGFVPGVESILRTLKGWSGHPKVVLCISAARDSETRALLTQAARESSIATIAVNERDPQRFAQDLYTVVVDPKVTHRLWKVVSCDSQELDEGPAVNAIDGDSETYWHTRYSPTEDPYPHEIVIDLGRTQTISGFRYMPRQDGGTNGRVKNYEFYVSQDGVNWGSPVSQGAFADTADPTSVHFDSAAKAHYIKFRALSEQHRQKYASAAEIDVLPGKA